MERYGRRLVIGGVHSVARHFSPYLIGQQGRNGIQAGGGGGGGSHIGGGGGPHIGGGAGGPQAAGPGGGGGGPHGAASAMPAPMPVAAIAIPPHNAVAPSNRRSLTVRNPISISFVGVTTSTLGTGLCSDPSL